MKKIIFPLFLLSIIFISCSNKPLGVEIKGKLSNSSGEKIYVDELTTAAIIPRDSATLPADGSFHFVIKVGETGFYRVRLSNNNFALLLLDSTDKIELNADAKKFSYSYSVKGSERSEKIAQVNMLLQKNFFTADSLKKLYASYQGTQQIDSIGRVLEMQFSQMKQSELSYLKKFIDENTSSMASLAVIDRLSTDTEMDYYIKLDKVLYKKYPNSNYVKVFHTRVSELNKLAIGTEAPEIILNTPEGKSVSLSSFRGKVVLVDFWASWCRPCRGENPNVVKAYNKFHPKGFEVLGVSLDNNKANWQKAINDDHLTWTHISDLGQWNSSVVKLYNITGIPFSVLVDKDGKIVAKGLRGEELENKLHELLP